MLQLSIRQAVISDSSGRRLNQSIAADVFDDKVQRGFSECRNLLMDLLLVNEASFDFRVCLNCSRRPDIIWEIAEAVSQLMEWLVLPTDLMIYSNRMRTG